MVALTVLQGVQLITSLVTLSFFGYVIHRRIQHEYYNRCVGDIVQVMFFKNSSFCVMMNNINNFIETSFSQFIDHVCEIFMDAVKK